MRRSGRAFVNDVHSRLNRTRHNHVLFPVSAEELRRVIRSSVSPIAICGARHAMGGQQFVADGTLLDTRRLNRVLSFDADRGLIEVEAGIQWPALIRFLTKSQSGPLNWAIRQKQTGADDLTIGGALSANVHGRGLAMAPIVADVEAFTLVDADGAWHRCSRNENAELFRTVIGGYGLFGVIYSVCLRLVPRRTLERLVNVESIERFIGGIDALGADYLYGDFQFAIDSKTDSFLRVGVSALYRALSGPQELPVPERQLHARDWLALLRLAFSDKSAAFSRYAAYYLSTHGQRYFSDTHQLGPYIEGYAAVLRRSLGWRHRRTLMITELYVPRERLCEFMAAARIELRAHNADLIYGTVRLIEADTDTFMPWAPRRAACVVFNLSVEHTEQGVAAARNTFVALIDRAIECGGSFYLTYHRWARRDQVLACYPNMPTFLAGKRVCDRRERFQSDWYRHMKSLVGNDAQSGTTAVTSISTFARGSTSAATCTAVIAGY